MLPVRVLWRKRQANAEAAPRTLDRAANGGSPLATVLCSAQNSRLWWEEPPQARGFRPKLEKRHPKPEISVM
eukprot:g51707.t1